MSIQAVLEKLALHRPELRAWAFYDWANSVFMTTVLMVFPIYFARVAAKELAGPVATSRFALATTLALTIVALLAPILGAIADAGGHRKKMLVLFLVPGVLATAGLAMIGPGDWLPGLALFVAGNIGVTGTIVFADSLLPHVARQGEMDRLATAGYALGYMGGGLLFAVNLVWILNPHWIGAQDSSEATRIAFASAAAWWAVFSLPLLLRIPEPPVRTRRSTGGLVSAGFKDLAETLRQLKRYRQAFLFLIAVLVYNDGINTVIRMATIYGTELGIPEGSLMGAILLVQVVGIPFSFAFGALADRIGAKRAIFVALVVYMGISLYGYFLRTAAQFWVMAGLVGTVQGGSQALSRSLFATLIPRQKSSEFFGFFGVFEKFAGVLGPAIFAAVVTLSGSSRPAIAAIVAFFVVGAILLAFVDVEEGRRIAREAEAEALLE